MLAAPGGDGGGETSTRVLDTMRWGLVPPHHKGELKDFKLSTFNCA